MFIIIELSSLIIFAFYLYNAKKNNQLDLFFYAAIFALFFENLSIMLFAGQDGGYYYHEGFNIFLFETPLFIVLLWSAIIFSTYNIVKRIVVGRARLFMAPLIVLSLDIILDQVATRFGLWTWYGFESRLDFFSVPASNYIGWLILPFLFFVTWEWLKDKKIRVLQPLLAYFLFIVLSLPLHFLKINFFNDNVWVQYAILFAFVVLFFGLLAFFWKENGDKGIIEWPLFLIRIFLHVFTLAGFVYLGMWKELDLLIVYFLIIIFELALIWKYFALVKNNKI